MFRAGINYVRVDVIVSDKNGTPVADLKQTDFEVPEDGKPQTVENFKFIKLDGGAVPTDEGPPRPIRNDDDEEQEAARDDVRLFAIFLDDYHVRKENSIRVRAPIEQFVQTQLGPTRHDRPDVSARIDLQRAHDAQSQRRRRAASKSFSDASTTTRRPTISNGNTRTILPKHKNRFGCACPSPPFAALSSTWARSRRAASRSSS